MASACRRLHAGSDLPATSAERAIATLASIDVRRYPHRPLLGFTWDERGRLTPYDAAYVGLARLLEAPLVTCDRQLARQAASLCSVELIERSGYQPHGSQRRGDKTQR